MLKTDVCYPSDNETVRLQHDTRDQTPGMKLLGKNFKIELGT